MRSTTLMAILVGTTFLFWENTSAADTDTMNLGSPPINLEGTWTATYKTGVDWELPVVGTSAQQVQVVSEWNISTNGLHFEATERVCKVIFTSSNPLIKMGIHPNAYPGISGSTYTGKWSAGTEKWSLKTRELRRVIGLKKPWPEVLPETIAAEQLEDTDGDGSPGLSLFLRGIIGADLSAIQEDRITFEAIPNKGKLTGTVHWTWKRKLIESSNPGVTELPREKWDPKTRNRLFTLEKGNNESCLQP